MEKVSISGSWRIATKPNAPAVRAIEADVRAYVAEALDAGHGIVTGGALGVDFWATDAALQCAKSRAQVRVILPTSLDVYLAHFRTRCSEGVISHDMFAALELQLYDVTDRGQLKTMSYNMCTPETYYARNVAVIEASDRLQAFIVNDSAGVAHAIAVAQGLGKPVNIRSYTL